MSGFESEPAESVGRTKVMVEGNGATRVKVKVEGLGKKKSTTAWTPPMYAEPPELFSVLENRGRSRREFAEKYGLAYLGGGPKSLKEGVDYSEEEMVAFYGPMIGKSNYRYTDCSDESVLARTEFLWMVLHQKSMMLSSRQISKGFAQAVFAEMRKNKKINWASQGEWTSAEQFRRRVAAKRSGKSLDETFDGDGDGEQIETEYLSEGVSAQSNVVQKQGSTLQGCKAELQRVTPTDLPALGKVWKAYHLFASDLVISSKESLSLRKSERDEYLVRQVRARNQFEDRNSHLAKAKCKLGSLCKDLEAVKENIGSNGVGDVEVDILAFQKRIDSQSIVVEVFQGLADEGQSELDAVSSLDLGFCVEVEALEDSHQIAERVESAVTTCVSRIDSGFQVFRDAQPQPCLGLVVTRSYGSGLLETCAFCAQGFEPVWAARFSSCKHLYHDWCFRYHFERNSKCAVAPCAAEMHERWWDAVGLKRPVSGVTTNIQADTIPSFPSTDQVVEASTSEFECRARESMPVLQVMKQGRNSIEPGTTEVAHLGLPSKAGVSASKRAAGATRFQEMSVKKPEVLADDVDYLEEDKNLEDEDEEAEGQEEPEYGEGEQDPEDSDFMSTPIPRGFQSGTEKSKRRSTDLLDRSPKKNKSIAEITRKKTLSNSITGGYTGSKPHEGGMSGKKRLKIPVTERVSTAKNTRGAQKGK